MVCGGWIMYYVYGKSGVTYLVMCTGMLVLQNAMGCVVRRPSAILESLLLHDVNHKPQLHFESCDHDHSLT